MPVSLYKKEINQIFNRSEKRLCEQLLKELNNAKNNYILYHSVRLKHEQLKIDCEIDFVLYDKTENKVFVIECKGGEIEHNADKLLSKDRAGVKHEIDPFTQVMRANDSFKKLRDLQDLKLPKIVPLVCFPDSLVNFANNTLKFDLNQVFDSNECITQEYLEKNFKAGDRDCTDVSKFLSLDYSTVYDKRISTRDTLLLESQIIEWQKHFIGGLVNNEHLIIASKHIHNTSEYSEPYIAHCLRKNWKVVYLTWNEIPAAFLAKKYKDEDRVYVNSYYNLINEMSKKSIGKKVLSFDNVSDDTVGLEVNKFLKKPRVKDNFPSADVIVLEDTLELFGHGIKNLLNVIYNVTPTSGRYLFFVNNQSGNNMSLDKFRKNACSYNLNFVHSDFSLQVFQPFMQSLLANNIVSEDVSYGSRVDNLYKKDQRVGFLFQALKNKLEQIHKNEGVMYSDMVLLVTSNHTQTNQIDGTDILSLLEGDKLFYKLNKESIASSISETNPLIPFTTALRFGGVKKSIVILWSNTESIGEYKPSVSISEQRYTACTNAMYKIVAVINDSI